MLVNKYIVADSRVCHGKPCFKGTRIMVHLVLELLAAGDTPEEIIREAYPMLTKRHIEAALLYAAHTAQEGRVLAAPLVA